MTEETRWAERIWNDRSGPTLLEFKGDTCLYKVQRWKIGPNHYSFGEVPTYHVWSNDKEVLATTDYLEAISKWREEVGMPL